MGRPEDYGQTINAVVWSQSGLSLFFLCLRVYCKFKKHRGLWWDDHVLIASWLALFVSSIISSVNVSLGFGKHVFEVNPAHFPAMGLNSQVASTVSIAAAVWSKTSFAMTLLRIESKGWTRYLIWFAIVSMNLFMGLNALAGWVQCAPIEKNWHPDLPGKCWDPKVATYYGVFAAGYSALMDILLAMLPWKLIWGLQMKMKEKIGVGVAMSMGVLAGSTAIVKCTTIPTLLSGDFTYDGSDLVIWGTVETGVTIVAASIPVLRVLVRDVASTARKYYGNSAGTRTGGNQAGGNQTGGNRLGITRSNTVTVTTTTRKGSVKKKDKLADDRSDRSILGDDEEPEFGKIVRTNEIVVEYDTRSDYGGHNASYEMEQMDRMNRMV
ncbi:hypothetical protein Cob_v002411 [Colletotrichum orbiculare MAFF 240422]|uniref:Rhodopsin domain-containing protein n=1 Tax=Colletotrichum orbiculare (strain 104-T / ATCC 96160 / CBS 514.97 / LARS 414 / MAFF 240422) TaxID=1213857 RepID=N4VLZ0_COLOR|nr:hypothetical protein Cob_v002411 [Colletotrichum orbiculare MAFF 240422]